MTNLVEGSPHINRAVLNDFIDSFWDWNGEVGIGELEIEIRKRWTTIIKTQKPFPCWPGLVLNKYQPNTYFCHLFTIRLASYLWVEEHLWSQESLVSNFDTERLLGDRVDSVVGFYPLRHLRVVLGELLHYVGADVRKLLLLVEKIFWKSRHHHFVFHCWFR